MRVKYYIKSRNELVKILKSEGVPKLVVEGIKNRKSIRFYVIVRPEFGFTKIVSAHRKLSTAKKMLKKVRADK
ncbi:MAG: hypothetical protein ACTSPL_03990 [Candidatus Odinarchaeia archaeon]